MAHIGPRGEEESSSGVKTDANQDSEKAAIATESKVEELDVHEEDSQALHSQPATMPVRDAVTETEGTVIETEGSEIGRGESKVDVSTQTESNPIENKSQANNDSKELSANENMPLLVKDEDLKLELDAAATNTQEKLNLDEEQAVNESATEDASTMQVKPDGSGLAAETQKEEVANAEVVKEDCQVPQNQAEGTPVSHHVTDLEGSETGEGENVDKSTHSNSEDEKQVMNESSADDASLMAASVRETAVSQEGKMQPQLSSSEKSGDITVEIEKQQKDEQIIASLKSDVEWHKAVYSQLQCEAAELSRRFGDAKMNLDRLKNILKDKHVAQECMPSAAIVAYALKNQTATNDAEEPRQQSQASEKKLSQVQQDKSKTQKQTTDMPSEIKSKEAESSTVDGKLSNIDKEMDAARKYLAAKINRQKQEINSLSKNNEELLQQYESEKAKNEKIEKMLNDYKEKMLERQNELSKANCDKYKAFKLMEEQQSKMKGEAESMMTSLTNELQRLETVFEEDCKLIQSQLSHCAKEIEMEKQTALPLLLKYKRARDQNESLIIKYLSTYITSVVLDETNRTMKERLGEDARLLERHVNYQRALEKLKDKVEAEEKELEDRNKEKEETVSQLMRAIDYYRGRFNELQNKYEKRST